jgi:hypothetical protein
MPATAIQSALTKSHPAASKAKLGDVVYDLLAQNNALVADLAAFRVQHNLLLAHLDVANVTGIGAANAATYGAAAATAVVVKTPEQRR